MSAKIRYMFGFKPKSMHSNIKIGRYLQFFEQEHGTPKNWIWTIIGRKAFSESGLSMVSIGFGHPPSFGDPKYRCFSSWRSLDVCGTALCLLTKRTFETAPWVAKRCQESTATIWSISESYPLLAHVETIALMFGYGSKMFKIWSTIAHPI